MTGIPEPPPPRPAARPEGELQGLLAELGCLQSQRRALAEREAFLLGQLSVLLSPGYRSALSSARMAAVLLSADRPPAFGAGVTIPVLRWGFLAGLVCSGALTVVQASPMP